MHQNDKFSFNLVSLKTNQFFLKTIFMIDSKTRKDYATHYLVFVWMCCMQSSHILYNVKEILGFIKYKI